MTGVQTCALPIYDQQHGPTPGISPGKIIWTTLGVEGINILCYNSTGQLGINTFSPTIGYALDVHGKGIFTGSVSAAAFNGSVFADDSSILVDAINSNITGNIITGNNIISSNLDIQGNGAFTGTVSASNLNIEGNVVFPGTVSAAAFNGSVFADDSSILVDGIEGTLHTNSLVLKNN
mgnify:FL=1